MAKSAAKSKKLGQENSVAPKRHLESVPSANYNRFWESSLFSDVYLQNDVPVKYKELWDSYAEPFDNFCAQFRYFCEELKHDDFNSWTERETINKFIKPVLRMLGYADKCSLNQEPWREDDAYTFKEHGESKTYKPDLVIVNDPRELKYIGNKEGQKKLDEARASVIIPIEAKYWNRIEDREVKSSDDSKRADKKDQSDSTRALDFDEQCLKYMEVLDKDYGILTDGKTWRLYNRELSSDNYHRNFQFNLGHLIKHVNAGLEANQRDYDLFIENAKYFFHIFSKRAVYSEDGGRRFLDDLLEYSKTYVTRVEDDLKTRFVRAMSHACNGFLRSAEDAKESIELSKIRNVAESHLFNILFIRHCESRGILPLKHSDYRKISLSNTIAKLEFFVPERETDNLNLPVLQRMFSKDFEFKPDGTELYERLLELTIMVQDGTTSKSDTFEIKGFKESIFSKDEWRFVRNHKLNNSEMVNILFELGYCVSDVPGKRFQQIPYNFFSPRQLGSIYESFLEFRLERATEDMIFVKKQWSPANLSIEKVKALDVPKVKRGQLCFSPDNKERKVSGSYYTPDYIVQYIIKETLGPIVRGKKSSEFSNIRICDPSMGSGHFISAALNYLAKNYLYVLEKETNDDLKITLQDAKRKLLHSCIFGVDINPRAVKLAKMSLWLESADSGEHLEDLDDQLLCGDAVNTQSFNWKKAFAVVFDQGGGFDSILMNPPYLGIKDNAEKIGYLRELPEWQHIVTNKYDLFYFFIARAIEILSSSGRMGCITTAYWPTADGAEKLRAYLAGTASPESFVCFHEIKLFSAAKGQHNLISIFQKGNTAQNGIRIMELEPGRGDPKLSSLELDYLEKQRNSKMLVLKEYISALTLREIQDGGTKVWNFNIEGGGKGDAILSTMVKVGSSLSDSFDIHSGIETGADRVTPKHFDPKKSDLDRPLTKYKADLQQNGIKKGDGIFVITGAELKSLGLSQKEKDQYIRPFIKNGDIKKKYSLEKKDQELFLIYFENGDLDSKSRIYKHLEKFKPILENRYKFRTEDRLKWFDLHRPLNSKVINSAKIISPYRSTCPIFVCTRTPVFSSIDVFYTIPLNKESNLYLALGLLNSKLTWYWLRHKGKMKGRMLELYSKPLGDIPFKNFAISEKDFSSVTLEEAKKFLKTNVKNVQECARLISGLAFKATREPKNSSEIEIIIDDLALLYYGLPLSARKFLDSYFESEEPEDASSEAA